MKFKTVVLGPTGQVGSALLTLLGDQGVGLPQDEVDFTRMDALLTRLEELEPAAVINAAAYTAVDQAEDEEALALVVNGTAVGEVARWCAARNIPLVHYSTDYVFSGTHAEPWKETDAVHPINAYGRTKLVGESAMAAAGGRWLVFRTSWVYDPCGKNFFTTMARLGQDRPSLKVVSDQIGAPTYAPHLARATLDALSNALGQDTFPSGVYHLCHGGVTSWHAFAQAIFAGLRQGGHALKVEQVEAVSTASYGGRVARPLDSRLDTRRAAQVLQVQLPSWEQGLEACLARFHGGVHAGH